MSLHSTGTSLGLVVCFFCAFSKESIVIFFVADSKSPKMKKKRVIKNGTEPFFTQEEQTLVKELANLMTAYGWFIFIHSMSCWLPQNDNNSIEIVFICSRKDDIMIFLVQQANGVILVGKKFLSSRSDCVCLWEKFSIFSNLKKKHIVGSALVEKNKISSPRWKTQL